MCCVLHRFFLPFEALPGLARMSCTTPMLYTSSSAQPVPAVVLLFVMLLLAVEDGCVVEEEEEEEEEAAEAMLAAVIGVDVAHCTSAKAGMCTQHKSSSKSHHDFTTAEHD